MPATILPFPRPRPPLSAAEYDRRVTQGSIRLFSDVLGSRGDAAVALLLRAGRVAKGNRTVKGATS